MVDEKSEDVVKDANCHKNAEVEYHRHPIGPGLKAQPVQVVHHFRFRPVAGMV